MKREELLKSKEYWLTKIQMDLFSEVDSYIRENKLTRAQLAEQLGVSKGYISQVLNGDADHRLSKLIELSLAIGRAPQFSFQSLDSVLEVDSMETVFRNYAEIEKSIKTLTTNGYMVGAKFDYLKGAAEICLNDSGKYEEASSVA